MKTDVYFYLKNAQGDIVGIIDANGEIKAEYVYDSWGKLISIKDENGVDISSDPYCKHKSTALQRLLF